jgi:hypothetical protein
MKTGEAANRLFLETVQLPFPRDACMTFYVLLMAVLTG